MSSSSLLTFEQWCPIRVVSSYYVLHIRLQYWKGFSDIYLPMCWVDLTDDLWQYHPKWKEPKWKFSTFCGLSTWDQLPTLSSHLEWLTHLIFTRIHPQSIWQHQVNNYEAASPGLMHPKNKFYIFQKTHSLDCTLRYVGI